MSYPKLLYRAFDELSYAQQFAYAGRFRIGRLDYYRNIENTQRADAEEGRGHYIDNDGISEHFEFGNSIYILSCSAEDVDLAVLRRKMGHFIIRINDPKQLVRDITTFFKERQIRLFGDVECRSVDYTKGGIIRRKLDAMERAELSIVQKPPNFSDEKEQRLYAIINAQCPRFLLASHIEIDLERPLPYVEVMGPSQ